MAAQFPTAIATDTDLLVAKNRAQTTLVGALNASATTFTLASDAFAANVAITMGSEIILILTKTGATVNTCTRGYDGTVAASHVDGSLVSAYIDAKHHNQMADEMKAVQTALGVNLANVAVPNPLTVAKGGTGVQTLTGIPVASGTTLWSAVAAASENQYLRRKPNAGATAMYEFTSAGVLKYPGDHNFAAQTPGGSLSIGSNTITLSPMPLGISADSIGIAQLHIPNGTGAAEVVPITGFSATTVTVTCANTHSGAWTIQSATTGVQEAIIATAGYGRVQLPSGLVPFQNSAGAATLTGCATVPGNYIVSLRGLGKGISDIRCAGLTGKRIYFKQGTSGYADVGDFTIRNTSALTHTADSMVHVSYKTYGAINNIEVENGYYGITTEACQNVQPQNCIVGADVGCYRVTTLGVAYPTAPQSQGRLAFCLGSLISATGATFKIEGAVSDLELVANEGGCVAPGGGNFALQILYDSTLGGQEISIIGGVYDGGSGIGITGDGVAYPTGFYILDGVECNGFEYGLFLDAKIANVKYNGGLIKGAGGTAQQSIFFRNAKNCRIDGVDLECLGAAAVTMDTTTDILLDGVVIGKNGTTPTACIAFGGAAIRTVIQNCDLGTPATKISGASTAANPLRLENNVGISDVIGTVASSATVILPLNPHFTISGTTTITAITSYLVAGSRGTFVCTGGPLYLVAGASIGNTVGISPNIPYAWHWDGTKFWVTGQRTLVSVAAAANSTSSLGSTILLTAPTAGVYRVAWALNTGSVSGGSGTALVTIGWTDTVGAKTSAGAALTLAAAANQSGSVLVNVASGNITYTTTYVAGTGGNYNLQLTAELVK